MSMTFSIAHGPIDFSRGITILFLSGKFFQIPVLVHYFDLGFSTKSGAKILEHILVNWNQDLNQAYVEDFYELQAELVKLFLTHEDFGRLACSPRAKQMAIGIPGIDINSIHSPEDLQASGIIFAYDDLAYLEDLNSTKLNPIVISFSGEDRLKKTVGFGVGQSYDSYRMWMKDLIDRNMPRFGRRFTKHDLKLDDTTKRSLLTGMYSEGKLDFKVSLMSFLEAAQFCKHILRDTASAKLNMALELAHCMPRLPKQAPPSYVLPDNTLFVPNL